MTRPSTTIPATREEPGIRLDALRLLRDRRDTLQHSDLTLYLIGHAAFQYLNAGCELNVFPLLHERASIPRAAFAESLDLPPLSARCLLFGLTSLGLIIRDGDDYRNCFAIEMLFAEGEWDMFLSTVRFESRIVYPGQADFVESLRQGKNVGLRHVPGTGETVYQRVNQFPDLQATFYDFMSSWSRHANPLLLENTDFTDVRRVLDVGGGDATNAIALAKRHPHLHVSLLDLPSVVPLARERISRAGVADRVEAVEGDLFSPAFPAGFDCFLFIHQLVIWSQEQSTFLLRKAYEALPSGGRVVIFNMMSNDDDSGPPFAALASVYFVSIAAGKGMIYSWKDYESCLHAAGFRRTERIPCGSWTPHGVLVAWKD